VAEECALCTHKSFVALKYVTINQYRNNIFKRKNLHYYLTDLKMVFECFSYHGKYLFKLIRIITQSTVAFIIQVQCSGKRSHGFKAKLSNDQLVHQTLPVP